MAALNNTLLFFVGLAAILVPLLVAWLAGKKFDKKIEEEDKTVVREVKEEEDNVNVVMIG